MIERPASTGHERAPGAAGLSAVAQAKAALRALIAEELSRITSEDCEQASVLACARLAETEVWRAARTILVYAPFAGELDIAPLVESALQQGKLFALPQYDPGARLYRVCQIFCPVGQVPIGRFGIREPGTHCPSLPLNQLDLALVPGVAFDLTGARLGRGRGYYDRLLWGLRAVKCGLGFDIQVQAQIPVEAHDTLLDCLLTPTRWLEIRPRRPGDNVIG